MIGLLDLDDVLNDLNDKLVVHYNRTYGENLTVADITKWELHEVVKAEVGVEVYKLFDDDFWQSLEPRVGAVEGTRRLMEMGVELAVVTATSYRAMRIKKPWLAEHFPHIPADNIVVTKRKDLVFGSFIVDDRSKTLRDVERAGSAWPICFDRPWNQDWDGFRVKSWDEVVEVVGQAMRMRRLGRVQRRFA